MKVVGALLASRFSWGAWLAIGVLRLVRLVGRVAVSRVLPPMRSSALSARLSELLPLGLVVLRIKSPSLILPSGPMESLSRVMVVALVSMSVLSLPVPSENRFTTPLRGPPPAAVRLSFTLSLAPRPRVSKLPLASTPTSRRPLKLLSMPDWSKVGLGDPANCSWVATTSALMGCAVVPLRLPAEAARVAEAARLNVSPSAEAL